MSNIFVGTVGSIAVVVGYFITDMLLENRQFAMYRQAHDFTETHHQWKDTKPEIFQKAGRTMENCVHSHDFLKCYQTYRDWQKAWKKNQVSG